MIENLIQLWSKNRSTITIWSVVSSLTLGCWFLDETNLLIQAIGQLITPILVKIIISLFLLSIGLGSSLFLLHKKIKTKPDFSKYIHSPEEQCWINPNDINDRICPTCKLDGILSPLSKSNSRWRCAKKEHGHFGKEIVACGRGVSPVERDRFWEKYNKGQI